MPPSATTIHSSPPRSGSSPWLSNQASLLPPLTSPAQTVTPLHNTIFNTTMHSFHPHTCPYSPLSSSRLGYAPGLQMTCFPHERQTLLQLGQVTSTPHTLNALFRSQVTTPSVLNLRSPPLGALGLPQTTWSRVTLSNVLPVVSPTTLHRVCSLP